MGNDTLNLEKGKEKREKRNEIRNEKRYTLFVSRSVDRFIDLSIYRLRIEARVYMYSVNISVYVIR